MYVFLVLVGVVNTTYIESDHRRTLIVLINLPHNNGPGARYSNNLSTKDTLQHFKCSFSLKSRQPLYNKDKMGHAGSNMSFVQRFHFTSIITV